MEIYACIAFLAAAAVFIIAYMKRGLNEAIIATGAILSLAIILAPHMGSEGITFALRIFGQTRVYHLTMWQVRLILLAITLFSTIGLHMLLRRVLRRGINDVERA
ncbi:MAG: hypothetical protein QXY39_06895 [Thermofilaceae archaeon]